MFSVLNLIKELWKPIKNFGIPDIIGKRLKDQVP